MKQITYIVAIFCVFVFLLVFSLSLVSSQQGINKDFNKNENLNRKNIPVDFGTIKIKNNGINLIDYTLNENTYYCDFDINCHASGTLNLHIPRKLFDKIEFQVSSYGQKFNEKDVTHIFQIKVNGQYEDYSGQILLPGVYEWRLSLKKNKYDTVDWIINTNGLRLTEWALFSSKIEKVEFYDENDNTQIDVKSNQWIAQMFTIGASGDNETFYNVEGIGLKLEDDGADSTVVTIAIKYNDGGSSGKPIGSSTAGEIAHNITTLGALPGSPDWMNFTLNQSIIINNSYQYALVVTTASTEALNWRMDSTSPTYTGGTYVSSSNGASWNSPDSSRDLMFQIYGIPIITGLDVELNSPVNNFNNINNNITFNATLSPRLANDMNLTNSTLFLYNLTGLYLTQTNITSGDVSNNTILTVNNLPANSYTWNVFGCGVNKTISTNTTCIFAPSNRTFNIGFEIADEFWNNSTTEGSVEPFIINVSVASGSQLITGNLHYNGTTYPGLLKKTGNDYSVSRSITIPAVTEFSTKNFFWELGFDFGSGINTTLREQGVANININDTCGTHDVLILEYTLKDEDTQETILPTASSNSTMEISVDLFPLGSTLGSTPITTFSKSFPNNSTVQICIPPEILNTTSLRMDAINSYNYLDHVNEFHHIQNHTLGFTTQLQNVSLFDLLTTRSQEFLITFKNANFLTVSNALVDIQRKYISEGVFKSVEIPKTDFNGQTLGHFVLTDEVYSITVTKEGKILSTFDNVAPICQDASTGQCTINLQASASGISPEDYQNVGGLNFLINFTESTRTVTSVFTSSGISTVLLNVTNFHTDEQLCSNTLTTSSGILGCVVPLGAGNVTIVATLFKDGNFAGQSIFKISSDTAANIFGFTGIIMTVILFLILPLMFITDKKGVLIAGMIGLVLAGSLTILGTGSIIGVGSIVIWAIIAGGILLYKISR